ncbi:MAG: alpha/beta hydrolase [Alphaproteobacteria bacterium]|nr:alpha/beta hydrolase [Alphaproteobacteria bacterium]
MNPGSQPEPQSRTTSLPVRRYVKSGKTRRVAVYEWGKADNPRVVICIHGMSRNARDFDWLARRLSRTHRVLAFDCPGRGRSDWLADPNDYQMATYIGDVADLLPGLGVAEADWVGTSMGGLMGMAIAADYEPRLKGLIRRLVLNDVGPLVPGKAMDRIGTYVGHAPHFETLEAAYAYQATVNAEWHVMTPLQRRRITRHSVRRLKDGSGFRSHYDPRIADALHRGSVPDLYLWHRWDVIKCPVLVVRGAESDILRAETAAEMQRRGPRATVIEIPGVGHTPSLMTLEQIKPIAKFLGD